MIDLSPGSTVCAPPIVHLPSYPLALSLLSLVQRIVCARPIVHLPSYPFALSLLSLAHHFLRGEEGLTVVPVHLVGPRGPLLPGRRVQKLAGRPALQPGHARGDQLLERVVVLAQSHRLDVLELVCGQGIDWRGVECMDRRASRWESREAGWGIWYETSAAVSCKSRLQNTRKLDALRWGSVSNYGWIHTENKGEGAFDGLNRSCGRQKKAHLRS